MNENFMQNYFYSKKKLMKLFGGEIKVYDENKTRVLFYVKQKAFKLKEDITVYSDDSMQEVLLKINAREIIDFSAAYDVTDAKSSLKIGALRRKGWKSMVRDYWEILDVNDQVIGSVEEDSMGKAALRRFVTNLIPQAFNIKMNDQVVGELKQTFNPLVANINADFSKDINNLLDRKMRIAILILIQFIEGRQR